MRHTVGSGRLKMKTRNDYLTNGEKKVKLSKYRMLKKVTKRDVARLKIRLIRSRGKLQKLSDVGAEHALRGDTKGLSRTLKMAYDNGLLKNKEKTLNFTRNLIENMTKKDKGKRYSSFTKSFYEVVKIWSGGRLVRFLSANLDGPNDRNVKEMCRSKVVGSVPGFQKNLDEVVVMYKKLMVTHNINSVLVEQAEDETVITKYLQYNQKSDTVVGTCGQKGPDHACLPDLKHVVGDDAQAYESLVQFFSKNVISSMARVIMFNPLHCHLPATVVFLGCTCNSFDHEYVMKQWETCKEIYKTALMDVFKAPLVGMASDGDSRRRKAMEICGTSGEGERFKVRNENFTLSGEVETTSDGVAYALNISNQDYVHNGKKWINYLLHTARVMNLGGHMAHMNHLVLVREALPSQRHGLLWEDVERKDRQNWASAQRLLFPRVQQCLTQLESVNEETTEDVIGTRVFLYIGFLHVDIFCSFKLSFKERIQNASTVVNFLRIWRWWVLRTPGVTLKDNFISRQSYSDLLISCHAAVLHMKAGREFTPDQPVPLPKTGSDCCEDLFSQSGSWVVNKHTYTFGDMLEMVPQMSRINQIRADPDDQKIPKGHKKQMNIWGKCYEEKITQQPDLLPYPSEEEMSQSWDNGLIAAQDICKSIGMHPSNFNPVQLDEATKMKEKWFFYPHIIKKDEDESLYDQMADEDEDLEIETVSQELDETTRTDDEVAAADVVQAQFRDELGTRINTKIKIPGRNQEMYKSTLISLLNNNPDEKISKDRLVRVQSKIMRGSFLNTDTGDNASSEIDYRKYISLYSDVAVHIINKSTKKHCYILGRFQRLLKKGKSRGKIEYKRPTCLDVPENENVECHLIKYRNLESNTYQYCLGVNTVSTFKNILMGVSLEVQNEGEYILLEDDANALKELMDSWNAPKKQTRDKRQENVITQPRTENNEVSVEVEPDTSSSNRRSERRRKTILRFDDQYIKGCFYVIDRNRILDGMFPIEFRERQQPEEFVSVTPRLVLGFYVLESSQIKK